jgi:HlyD family secretion protein
MTAESTQFRDTSAQDQVLTAPGFLRRRRAPLLIGAVLVVGVALAVPRVLRFSGIQATVAASRITVATVERGDFVRDFVADGRVVAANSPTQYAPASGTVALLVRAGDKVKRGQVLARMPARIWRRGCRRSRRPWRHCSSICVAPSLRQTGRPARRRGPCAGQPGFHLRETRVRTHAQGLRPGAFSEMQLLRAQDVFEKARFHLEQAQRNLQSQPEQGRVEVQGRDAMLRRQQVAVEDLARQVKSLEIVSPVDGQVGQLQVADHANVARDAPLLSVVDLSLLEVEIQAPESLARDLAPAMQAELSGNGSKWQGTISAVSRK